MKDASKKIIDLLKERGYRITKARTDVTKTLIALHEPTTIKDLAVRIHADEASVYRTIGMLRHEGFVEEVRTKEKGVRYAFSHGHHHHVVCTNCQKVAHIHCDEELKAPRHVAGFSHVTSHEVTYYGTCDTCH